MKLVAPDTGWALTDKALTLTEDGGGHWRDVTPQGIAIDQIRGVLFLNGSTGWIGAVTPAAGDGSAATMAVLRTLDGGRTWERATVPGPVNEIAPSRVEHPFGPLGTSSFRAD